MGLTIHYSLHADVPNADGARSLVERLHQTAMDLPFAEVGEIVELTGDATDFENAHDGATGWLLVQARRYIEREGEATSVRPDHVIAFSTLPGPGCEWANFGLCQYPATADLGGKTVPLGVNGWNWASCCKTQYASNPSEGGVENFLRCHLLVIEMLDQAQRLGILKVVEDEGGYWENRDTEELTREIRRWNEVIAGLVGQLKDNLAHDFQAPIRDYPDFEHLEAKGRDTDEAPTPVPQPGERIRLVAMRNISDRIEPGQTGTVNAVRQYGDAQCHWYQIDVAWDDGRSSTLIAPPDQVEIVDDESDPT